MNTGAAVGLFFAGSFALIVTALRLPAIEFYTGGIFIALFMAGLFYSWGNAIRQVKNLEQKEGGPKETNQNEASVVSHGSSVMQGENSQQAQTPSVP